MGTFLIVVLIILAVLVSLNGTGKLENIKAQLSNYQKSRAKNSNTGYLRSFADYLNTDPFQDQYLFQEYQYYYFSCITLGNRRNPR